MQSSYPRPQVTPSFFLFNIEKMGVAWLQCTGIYLMCTNKLSVYTKSEADSVCWIDYILIWKLFNIIVYKKGLINSYFLTKLLSGVG